jgi:uncharacterized protein (DUF58 family)
MLSERAVSEAGIFLALAIAGIALGNTMLIYLSLVPFFFIVYSLVYGRPGDITVTREEGTLNVWTNENVQVPMTIAAGSGAGIVTVADSLPEHFELVSGNNFHIFWNDGLPGDFSYEVKCTRRGTYHVGPTQIECIHHSWMEQTAFEATSGILKLNVRPGQLAIKKMRELRLLSNMPMPMAAQCKLGMRTNDFMEIKEYSHGDPYRFINWKVTARLSMAHGMKPYVNEYEKEGKRTVFIFIDGGAWMSLGSTIDNVFEYAVQAASGIASFYLERDVRVGVYVYNHGELVLPDTGRKQASRIMHCLTAIQANDSVAAGENGLKRAMKLCRGHLTGVSPLFIVITMVGKDNTRDLIEGVRSMRWYSGKAKASRVIVLHIAGYELEASDDYKRAGAALLDMDILPCLRAVKKTGAFVVPWNPRTKSLSQLMVTGFKRRS